MDSQEPHKPNQRLGLQAIRGPVGPQMTHSPRMGKNGRATCFSPRRALHGRAGAATPVQGQYPGDSQRCVCTLVGAGDERPVEGCRHQGQVPGLLLLAEGTGPRLPSSRLSAVSLSALPVGRSAPCRPRHRADSNQTFAKRARQGLKTENALFDISSSTFPATDGRAETPRTGPKERGRRAGSPAVRPGGSAPPTYAEVAVMTVTIDQKRFLLHLDDVAHQPVGPCGRVTFNLWWTQQGEARAQYLFAGHPALAEIISIGRELAAGRA